MYLGLFFSDVLFKFRIRWMHSYVPTFYISLSVVSVTRRDMNRITFHSFVSFHSFPFSINAKWDHHKRCILYYRFLHSLCAQKWKCKNNKVVCMLSWILFSLLMIVYKFTSSSTFIYSSFTYNKKFFFFVYKFNVLDNFKTGTWFPW